MKGVNPEIIDYLIKNKININTKDINGWTDFIYLISY